MLISASIYLFLLLEFQYQSLDPKNSKFFHYNGQLMISVFYTWAPPDTWWIIILAFGRACRMPGAPDDNNKDPIEAAWPTHLLWKRKWFSNKSVKVSDSTYQVATGALMYCIVSYIARPAVTLPPGEFMYMWMGFVLLSDCVERSN